MYQKIKPMTGCDEKAVLRLQDRVSVLFDPANTDYQAYLAWLAEGNEPLPADNSVNKPA